MTAGMRRPAPLSLLVFITGLVSAVASGLWTYRELGMYGGPNLTGYHQEWNPKTGQHELIHETTNFVGTTIRRRMDNSFKVKQTELSGTGVAAAVEELATRGARFPFSTLNDGVIDAWATRDAAGQTARVEVSTKRDGKIDRWEQYANGQLVRVDLDTNGNGKADRWMTYEGGILMDTFVDANEDGQPDGPPTR